MLKPGRHHKSAKQTKYHALAKPVAYLGIFTLVVGLAYTGHATDSVVVAEKSATNSQQALPAEVTQKPSIDQLASTNLAAALATNADLPVATNVTNQAISLAAKSELSQTSDESISKPLATQAVDVASHDIITYKTQAGDTADSVAKKFNVSKDTVKWSNNLQGDAIEPNRDIVIPPVDGLIATAQAGDTAASLAQKYGTDPQRVVLFNDFELNAPITTGIQVIIPGGRVVAAPAPPQSSSTGGASSSNISSASLVVAGGNGYDYGYCTWYAYNRRAALGMPIGGMWGNASSWATLARASGFLVNNTPSVGAVMQTAYAAGGYGHVAVVESVNPDGSILVSEMNYAGWNRKSTRTLSAGEASSYNYIH